MEAADNLLPLDEELFKQKKREQIFQISLMVLEFIFVRNEKT